MVLSFSVWDLKHPTRFGTEHETSRKEEKMKRIDLECHYLTEDMLSVFGKRTSAPFFQKETRLLT